MNKRNPVVALGGCARASGLLTMANMDLDSSGQLSQEALDAAQQIVDASKDEMLNAGVVSALILSILDSFESLQKSHRLLLLAAATNP